eukprot:4856431-Prymnesium_polylepis.1
MLKTPLTDPSDECRPSDPPLGETARHLCVRALAATVVLKGSQRPPKVPRAHRAVPDRGRPPCGSP